MAPNIDRSGLLESGSYSDLTIVCDGHQFPVHKNIVCSASPVLDAQMQGPWTEAQTGVIHVQEFDAGTVLRLLSFLYRKAYLDDPSTLDPQLEFECDPTNQTLLIEAHMIAIAQYYQVEELKVRAVDDFLDSLELKTWSSIGFGEVIRYIYGLNFNNDSELKTKLCGLCLDNWEVLGDDDIFQEATTGIGEFYGGLLKNMTLTYQAGVKIEEQKHQAQLIADRAQTLRDVGDKDAIIGGLRSQLDYQKRINSNLNERYHSCLQDLKDLNDRLDKTSADLLARTAPRTSAPQRLMDVETQFGTEIQIRKMVKLTQLYTGCCGDSKKRALARKDSHGDWVLHCRLCTKKYTVKGLSAKYMTVAS